MDVLSHTQVSCHCWLVFHKKKETPLHPSVVCLGFPKLRLSTNFPADWCVRLSENPG